MPLQATVFRSLLLPLPYSHYNTRTASRDRYVRGLVYHVGSADALVPPVPPLTRYKRELAAKAEREDSRGAAATIRARSASGNLACGPSVLMVLQTKNLPRLQCHIVMQACLRDVRCHKHAVPPKQSTELSTSSGVAPSLNRIQPV